MTQRADNAPTLASLRRELEQKHPATLALSIEFGGWRARVRSNSPTLLDGLSDYFGDLVTARGPAESGPVSDVELLAIECAPLDWGLSFRDWPREAGKAGQKEQFFDLSDGRVVFKVRTHMQFLIGEEALVAAGPCVANANQIINFVNSQYISQRVHEGWALCHAAAVAHGGRGLGIAARAGAGKSTLALHLISSGLSFVSNDRLLIKRTERGPELAGIPKMPRVNPGTLLNNPDLHGILTAERERQLALLSREELWGLEEKYDVLVDQVYGKGRTLYRAALTGLLVLNWSFRNVGQPAEFRAVSLAERPDLLELVRKSPGVFHRDAAGRNVLGSIIGDTNLGDAAEPEAEAVLEAVAGVRVWEATGSPQFDQGVSFCRRLLEA
jgi:HprK-related kinase B